MSNLKAARLPTDVASLSTKKVDDDLVFEVDPSVKARRRDSRIAIGSRLLVGVVALGLWQFVSGRYVDEFWISSPSLVVAGLVKLWQSGTLLTSIYFTVLEALAGFVVGTALGMLVGITFGANRLIARIFDPYLVGFYSIPRVALIPLFILWFGIGFQTKVIYTSMLVFFPVFMNTFSGVRDVNRDLIDVIRVMGASRSDTIRRILIPSALSWLFAGLRISVPYALVGAVVAEMFTSNVGLGYLISYYANSMDTANMFAALSVTTALGLMLNAVVSRIERRLLRWKPAGDAGH